MKPKTTNSRTQSNWYAPAKCSDCTNIYIKEAEASTQDLKNIFKQYRYYIKDTHMAK
jgi:hypothetical protein